MPRLNRDAVASLFWKARKRAGGDAEIAAVAVYDEGFRAAMEIAAGEQPPERRAEFVTRRARPFIAAVAARHGTDPETLTAFVSKGPRAETAARDEAMWLMRCNNFSYPEISMAMNRKDHTSAMDGVRRVEARIVERPALRDELLALMGGARPALKVGWLMAKAYTLSRLSLDSI